MNIHTDNVVLVMVGLALLTVGGCTSTGLGSGGSAGGSATTLQESVAETRAAYQILNLSSGTVTAAGSIPDLTTNPAYRTTMLVMRLVQPGSATIGTPSGALGSASDNPATAVTYGRYYLGVFATTQAQWQLLAGTSPWTQLSSANGSGDIQIGASYPAIGISWNAAQAACANYAASHGLALTLPSDVEWEVACRAGSTAVFSWGATMASATVASNALVWETANGRRGAQVVGSLQPNAFGFYDMEGNVWQLSQQGHLRGGSWNDALASARCANIATIDPATSHLLVGIRLCFTP